MAMTPFKHLHSILGIYKKLNSILGNFQGRIKGGATGAIAPGPPLQGGPP